MADRKQCPNCGGPEYIPSGVGTYPIGRMYYCGYQDSEDGIVPPKLTPMCRYAAALLARVDELESEREAARKWSICYLTHPVLVGESFQFEDEV